MDIEKKNFFGINNLKDILGKLKKELDKKYDKKSGGIPKSDLDNSVQTSLGKADTALQSYTEKYTGTYSKPSGGIPKTDLASAVQTSLGKADTALQSFTETDPTVPAWAKAASKPTYTAAEVGALPSTTVIPDISGKANKSGDTFTGTVNVGMVDGHKVVMNTSGEITNYKSTTNYVYADTIQNDTNMSSGLMIQSLNSKGLLWTINRDGTTDLKPSGYATEKWVTDKGYLTSHQDISGKLDKDGASSSNALQINPTGASYNEGIRIGRASNGWSEVQLGCSNTTTTGTVDGQWTLGRRGAAGSKSGGVGDFTIEHNGSNGTGLTLYKNGNTPTWNGTAFSMDGHTHSNYLTGITKAMVTTALGYTPPTSDTNTTYTIATGDANGQIKVTPSSGTAYNVSVKGLGSLAYSSAIIPTNTNQLTNGAGFITGITKAMVTTALGYTPPTSDTNTWRPIGTGATDAAAGNHTHSQYLTQHQDISQVWQNRSIIGNTVDFNTLTDSGCYKVQMSSWGAANTYHGPNTYLSTLYSFGLLLVFRATTTDGEKRVTQIYFPHSDTAPILTRMHNGSDFSSGWNNWKLLYTDTWRPVGTGATDAAAGNHTHSNYLTGITKAMVTTALGYTPPTTDTNTTYSAGTALSLSGTTFNVSLGTGATQAAAGNHTHSYLPLSGGTVGGAITFSANDDYGIFTATNNYCCIGASDKKFYCSYINYMYGANTVYTSGGNTVATTYYGTIKAAALSASRTYTLPDKAGTIAMTSDIPGTATTSANGLMSSTDKTKLNAIGTITSSTTKTVSTAANVDSYTEAGTITLSAGTYVIVATGSFQTTAQYTCRVQILNKTDNVSQKTISLHSTGYTAMECTHIVTITAQKIFSVRVSSRTATTTVTADIRAIRIA